MRLKMILAMVIGVLTAPGALAQGSAAAPPAPDPENILVLDLSSGGQVQVLLRPDKAPNAVDRIKVLTRRGFYNGLTFHRVIEGFMAQGGDPKGDGTGGSDLPDLKAEFSDLPHVRGTMSMARAADADSANSQFFIMLMPNLSLDGHYTVVGRVISGMQYIDAIEKGEPPANPTRIIKAAIASGDTPVPAASVAPSVAAVPAVSAKEQAKADKEARRAMEEAIRHAEEDKENNARQ